MPSARADEFRRAAAKLGFLRAPIREPRALEAFRWARDNHSNSWRTGNWSTSFLQNFVQLGIDEEEFDELR